MKTNNLINVCIQGSINAGYLKQNFKKSFNEKSRKVLIERIESLKDLGLTANHIAFIITSYLKGYEEGLSNSS